MYEEITGIPIIDSDRELALYINRTMYEVTKHGMTNKHHIVSNICVVLSLADIYNFDFADLIILFGFASLYGYSGVVIVNMIGNCINFLSKDDEKRNEIISNKKNKKGTSISDMLLQIVDEVGIENIKYRTNRIEATRFMLFLHKYKTELIEFNNKIKKNVYDFFNPKDDK